MHRVRMRMKTKILTMMTGMIDRRDELVYKRLGGEKLSLLEKKYVDVMNKVLEYSLPAPSPLPNDVKAAIEEINTLARERK